MNTRSKAILAICLSAGFVVCTYLTRLPQGSPEPISNIAPTAVAPSIPLTAASDSNPQFVILDNGNWWIWADGSKHRNPPPENYAAEARAGYYDTFESLPLRNLDLIDQK